MASSVPDNVIDEQAAQWAARASGEAPADVMDRLARWLDEDRRHRGAYLRARAALLAMDDELGGVPSARAGMNDDAGTGPRWPRLARARHFRAACGAALAAALVGAIGLGVTSSQPSQPRSDPRGTRDLTLADGSIARLTEGAQVRFGREDGVRRVLLVKGEALFEVAKDPAHPFVVQSGEVYAQATGTVYAVRRFGRTGGAVRVDEGSVLVWARDDREQAVLLRAGGALTLEPGPQPLATAGDRDIGSRPVAPPPKVAQIALDDVSIADAAARFNRVNRTQIVIADPSIGETEIVGLFRANDPARFARSAAAIAGADVEIRGEQIVMKSKQN